MRERGILFSAPMVRAILDGTKTQTRRVVNVPRMEKIGPASSDTPEDFGFYAEGKRFSGWMVLARGIKSRGATNNDDASIPCPFGEPGDRLWVRETYLVDDFQHDEPGARKRANTDRELREAFLREIYYRADGECCDQIAECGCEGRPGWTPSILMPRWASRITLEVTDVRVERVQSISDDDILAEGVTVEAVRELLGSDFVSEPLTSVFDTVTPVEDLAPRDLWRVGWSAINGAESWDANPWLWCLTFRRVEP